MKQTVYTASTERQQSHVWSLKEEGSVTVVQVVDGTGRRQPRVVQPGKRFT